MLSGEQFPSMPCHYPEGDPLDWCERHRSDARMLRAMREDGSALPVPA